MDAQYSRPFWWLFDPLQIAQEEAARRAREQEEEQLRREVQQLREEQEQLLDQLLEAQQELQEHQAMVLQAMPGLPASTDRSGGCAPDRAANRSTRKRTRAKPLSVLYVVPVTPPSEPPESLSEASSPTTTLAPFTPVPLETDLPQTAAPSSLNESLSEALSPPPMPAPFTPVLDDPDVRPERWKVKVFVIRKGARPGQWELHSEFWLRDLSLLEEMLRGVETGGLYVMRRIQLEEWTWAAEEGRQEATDDV